MAPLRRFVLRVLSLFRTERAEQELSREIDAHLALIEDDLRRQGMTDADARLAARRAFGGVDQAKERHRDARAFRWIDDARRDFAYAVRSLRRSRGFTSAAVVTLALGIGATTAIYSVADAILLQPLPLPDSERLVRIIENERPSGMQPITYQEYLEWRDRTTTLEGLAAITFNPQAMLMTREGAVRVAVAVVSTNYFEVLGATPMRGRALASSDEAFLDVAVITESTWRRQFRASEAIVGSTIELRSGTLTGASRLVTIVGIMPDNGQELGVVDLYTTIVLPPNARPLGLNPLIGRLKAGVSVEAASSEANIIGSALRPPRPDVAPPLTGPRIEARNLKDDMVSGLRPALRVFAVAVGVLLLIVCANVASLLLARGVARRQEMAMRMALGAGRGRIVRQLLTECVVLALAGGLLGAIVGAAGVTLVRQLATVEAEGIFRLVFGGSILPRGEEVVISLRVLLIALGLSMAASMVFGVLPALQLSRNGHTPPHGGARGASSSRAESRTRGLLVCGQLVMATVLLVAAGLLGRSLLNLLQVEKGYDPTNVIAFQLVLPPDYATLRKTATIEHLLARLRAIPDVEAAGFAYAGILLSIENTVGTFVPPGRELSEFAEDQIKPRLKALSGGYFETMRLRVLDGRGIDGRDRETDPLTAVINRSAARRLFGQSRAVGQTLTWHLDAAQPAVQVTVAGVVEDVRQAAVDRDAYPEVFMDYRQVIAQTARWGFTAARQEALAIGFMSFAVKTSTDFPTMVPQVRRAVLATDFNAGIDAIQPMETLVANSMARQRFYAVLLGVFAVIAAVLAGVGVYGALAYAVMQRTREIGVRMALGAERRQVVGMILRRGIGLAVVGILVGLGGAFAGARYLEAMLFGVQPRDVVTFAIVAIGFAAVAIAASYLPARRAAAVDPAVALRME
jgi:putative ABC transport system permease protein